MDSDEDEELFPIPMDVHTGFQIFQYNDPFLVSGVLRAVVMEDLEKIKHLLRSGHSVNINDNNGNTPLHIAVIKKNFSIVKYLLDEEGIVINLRNFYGQTPLFIAVKNGNFELTQYLVKNGANVNLPNYQYITPLHASIQFPNIAHLLITNGADLDTLDYSGDTPLHDAVADCHLETVCMLLFYNADANIHGNFNLTPFMKALISGNYALQEALFEYVDDFNISTEDGVSTLDLALTHDNIFVEEIINRGATVDILTYMNCLKVPNLDNFKIIWNKLPPEDVNYVTLVELVNMLDENNFCYYMDIIMEDTDCSIMSVIAENLKSSDMAKIVEKYSKCKFGLVKLTKLTFIFLQHRYKLDSLVITAIFSNYGYCELIKLLLFIDYVGDWTPFVFTARLIFDIKSNIREIYHEAISAHNFATNSCLLREEIISLFGYWVYRPMIDLCRTENYEELCTLNKEKCLNITPLAKLPSLLELARDKTREHIVERLKPTTASQYYTVINHLDISPIFKKILMFEMKIYQF